MIDPNEDYNALVYGYQDAKEYVLIDWNLWNICNYSCSYCPEKLHNSSVLWHPFPIIVAAIDKILLHYNAIGKKCVFQFTGWEVSLNSDLLKILVYIKSKWAYTSIISNLSRNMVWWKNVLPYLDNVIVTYHSEFVVYKDFIKRVIFISWFTDIYVCVTIDPDFFNDRKIVVEKLKFFAKRFNFTVFAKPLFINFGNILYSYTQEQKVYMENASYMNESKYNHIPSRKMVKVNIMWKNTLNKGNLLLENKNSWMWWECFAWINLLVVKSDWDVFRWQCMEGWRLWNIFKSFELPNEWIICRKQKCNCLSDIMVPKYKI